MKFSIYDMLSNIIPGFLIFFSLLILADYSFRDLDITITLMAAYIIGYLNNTISSWSEGLIFWSWGGKPSDQILSGKNIWKVKFYDNEKVKEYLTKESNFSNPSNDELFQIAMRYANLSTNERVRNFNSNYALSRNLIISFIITAIIINIKYWFNVWIVGNSVLLIIIVWLRAKQRGFYFAREVLKTYIHIKENNKIGKYE